MVKKEVLCYPEGGLYHLLPKFEHIFVAVITFSPFFCPAYCVRIKMICEISLKTPFLRRYIQTHKGHSKIAPPKLQHI